MFRRHWASMTKGRYAPILESCCCPSLEFEAIRCRSHVCVVCRKINVNLQMACCPFVLELMDFAHTLLVCRSLSHSDSCIVLYFLKALVIAFDGTWCVLFVWRIVAASCVTEGVGKSRNGVTSPCLLPNQTRFVIETSSLYLQRSTTSGSSLL